MAKNFAETAYQILKKCLSSKWFFALIVSVAVFQGFWYAFSFQPSMYDEARHFDFTRLYSTQYSPFIAQQNPEWDFLGEVTREPNYLFYYLMSWPLRLATVFTSNTAAQLIFLRLICICFFAVALIFYKRAFRLAGASRAVTNVVLAFFVLTPGVAILPGVFNYDNVTIFLTALLLYLAVKTLKDKKINFSRLSVIATIGLLGSPIKMTFLAIYAPVVLVLIYQLWRHHRHRIVKLFSASFSKTALWLRIILITAVALSGFLFAERTIGNLVMYRKMAPSCTRIMSVERCLVNPVTQRNFVNSENRKAQGKDFKPIIIPHYFLIYWFPKMIVHQASPTRVLPVTEALYYVFAFSGLVVVLLYARELFKNRALLLMGIAAVTYSAVTLLYNYSSYLRQGLPVATNGRYLFPVIPIFMLFTALAFVKLFGKYKKSLAVFLIVVALLMSQGAGITTYILDNFEAVYWQNKTVQDLNALAEDIAQPLIKE